MSQEAVKQSEREVLAAAQIGGFIFCFSQVEGFLRIGLAGALLLPPDIYEAVTASYDFVRLCDVTLAVCRFRWSSKPEKVAALEKIISRCKRVNEVRVRIVHGTWMPSSSSGYSVRHMSRSMRVQDLYTEQDELGRDVEECQKLSQDLVALFLF